MAELAAAGKPAVLVPFPFASDDHQLRNAQALERAGAARLVRDVEMSGERLFDEVRRLSEDAGAMERMAAAVRQFAKPDAGLRAAEILEQFSVT